MTALVSRSPRTGEELGSVEPSTVADVEAACRRAGSLFRRSRRDARLAEQAPALLRALADALERRRADVVDLVDRETALGQPRVTGELARTAFQLRAFADYADDDRLWDAVVDTADGDRVPPRADQRRMNVPVGPVGVFAASNFPLAFGLLGGDTASALAARCPVVAKAHPAQPLTGALVAEVVAEAVEASGADADWVQVVSGAGADTGTALVMHPDIAAVGFTGSFGGGRALVEAASTRPRPIPVYAEMGSINPSFLAPHAAASRAEEVGRAWAGTMVANAGQLCTQPGLLLVPGDAAEQVVRAAVEHLGTAEVPPMLGERLAEGFTRAVDDVEGLSGVTAHRVAAPEGPGVRADAVVLSMPAGTLLSSPAATEEMFGPAGIVVQYEPGELDEVLDRLPGSLASAVIADPEDRDWVADLVPRLQQVVGRIVFDRWPVGVSVGDATVHGGPWPATSAPATTSVGTAAAHRFVRPVALENFPADLLPERLRS